MRGSTVDGTRCRKLREDQGLTLQQLANMISANGYPVTWSMLSKIECGTRQPSEDLFVALFSALDADPYDVLADERP